MPYLRRIWPNHPEVVLRLICSRNICQKSGKRYLYGETDLEQAVEQAVSQVKLYLAE